MNLSAIIPVLNEEEFIGRTIDFLKSGDKQNFLKEIIVIDSGSKDHSIEIAKSKGCKVYQKDFHVKYEPLNYGASLAKGDVLIFVDADTHMPTGYSDAIFSAFKDDSIVGGAFEFSFIENHPLLKIIIFINRVRYRLWKRYYGDQSVFVRKNIFNAIGQYPKRDILESSYLCIELEKKGKLKLIPMKIKTSGRRFLDGGILKVFAKDCKIWFLDLIGFNMDRFGKAYWSINRNRSKE